ncbi:MAG: hypothetical protein V5A88_07345 [Candidatus Thermoplasmatota archaeon]
MSDDEDRKLKGLRGKGDSGFHGDRSDQIEQSENIYLELKNTPKSRGPTETDKDILQMAVEIFLDKDMNLKEMKEFREEIDDRDSFIQYKGKCLAETVKKR